MVKPNLSTGNCNPPSNLVKVSLATGRNSPPTLGINIDDVHILQLLKYVTSNSTAALTEMRRSTAIPLASSIDSLEGTNTKAPPQVYFPQLSIKAAPGYIRAAPLRDHTYIPRT